MSYKTILVHINSDKRCAARLEVAIQLAKKYEACLVGLHAFFPYTPPGYIMAHMGAEVIAAQQKLATEAMSQTGEAFQKQTSAAGLENKEWHTAHDDPVSALSLQARYADLIVIGQSGTGGDSEVDKVFPERLILVAGRPVLVVPEIGDFPCVGKRIIVAWNASREAARAVTNAIPFLKLADKVYVMTVQPKASENESIATEQIVQYLSRHGVGVEVEESHGVEIGVANELLSRASDLSVDLLVMGCYGHSRVREWILGGATRTILESMTIPVLMSH
jgi:nucleotide-binding universal stress UspA family protein